MSETAFIRDIALVFVAALAGGALAQWLRQPLFVGYIIGGLLISPFTPGASCKLHNQTMTITLINEG